MTLQDLEFHTNNFNVSPVLPVMTSDLFQSWSLSPDRSTILFHGQVAVWGRLSATFCADYFFSVWSFHEPHLSISLVQTQPVHNLIKAWGRWGIGEDVLASAGCIPESSCVPEGMEEHLLGWQGEVAMVATIVTLTQHWLCSPSWKMVRCPGERPCTALCIQMGCVW